MGFVRYELSEFGGEIWLGDSREVLAILPEASVDMVFADPPYNLQLRQELERPDGTIYRGVTEDWDKFESFEDYDAFTVSWLSAVRRVMKPDATIWVMGTYHNIFRVGKIMQDLGFWILNDIIWHKVNPPPNFRGVRFQHVTETIIWAAYSKKSRYVFNYKLMKALNGGKQMQSVWRLPICQGSERLRSPDGTRLHPAQKPLLLLERIVLASTRENDLVLDPFLGTGTTAVAAVRHKRRFIGIDISDVYVQAAINRIRGLSPPLFSDVPESAAEREKPPIL